MSYTQGKIRTYIPEALGNRQKAPSEQIVAELLTPTEDDKREVLVGEEQPGRTELQEGLRVQRRSCELFVKSLTNCTHRGIEIKTGLDLRMYGHDALLAELAAEVLAELSLTEPEKKTSAEPSGSSPLETQASAGTAASASAPSGAGLVGASRARPEGLPSSSSSSGPESSPDAQKPGSAMKAPRPSG